MITTDTEPMAYLGRKPCGCAVFCTVDRPERAKDTAREVAKEMRAGLTIERVTVEVARQAFSRCTHKKAKAQQPEMAL